MTNYDNFKERIFGNNYFSNSQNYSVSYNGSINSGFHGSYSGEKCSNCSEGFGY